MDEEGRRIIIITSTCLLYSRVGRELDHDTLVAGATSVNDLRIPLQGMTSVYKPTKWNQGGYDVMFVTVRGS